VIAETQPSENLEFRDSHFSPKAHVASLRLCSLIVDSHVVDQAGPEGVSPSDHGQEARHTWGRRFPIRNQQSAIQTQPTTVFHPQISPIFADFQLKTVNGRPIFNHKSHE
jgi:hypothetical protein